VLCVVIAGLFSACGPSKYVSVTDTGLYGYSEWPRDSATWQVSFVGNGYTNLEIVDRYALFRAAELAVSKGYDSFIVLDHTGGSHINTVRLPETNEKSTVSCPDPRTPSVTTADYFLPIPTGFRHASTLLIRLWHGRFNGSNSNVFDARQLIATMAPSIARNN